MDTEILSTWRGPIIFIGFGSIAQGLLPLISRHIYHTDTQLFFIEPKEDARLKINCPNATIISEGLTAENYQSILDDIVKSSNEKSLIINLSVDVSSVAIIAYCQDVQALYVDTVIEPWANYYANADVPLAKRTNYFLREELLGLRKILPKGTTAISCCGANPGMVSWLTKEALLQLATDIGLEVSKPNTREQWANLMQQLEVKGIHIAERDSQIPFQAKVFNEFTNTWSVEGLIAESKQPAELGWGTHEQNLPKGASEHATGSKCAIYLGTVGGQTKISSWVPSGPQEAYLITHNEAITLSEYFSVYDETGTVTYRPTCNYAYRPCDETVMSLEELFSTETSEHQHLTVLSAEQIKTGKDELGVLLYGHKKNAYWYGSILSIEDTKKLAPNQNATGLQVSSAVLAGVIWMIENPNEGIVEVEEIDHEFCLSIQKKYLGEVTGVYTDWYPENNILNSPIDDNVKCWQFSDILKS